MKNFKQYLTKYFDRLEIPKISPNEAEILIEEIVKMVEILENYPNISYSDLWDKIHD